MEQQLTIDKNELRAKSKNYIQPLMKKITMKGDIERKSYNQMQDERFADRDSKRKLLSFEEMYDAKKEA